MHYYWSQRSTAFMHLLFYIHIEAYSKVPERLQINIIGLHVHNFTIEGHVTVDNDTSWKLR